MEEILVFRPIGIIQTPFKTPDKMPVQPSGAKAVKGTVVIDPEYEDGLEDLDGFSHIILVYCFHRSKGFSLKVIPFLDDQHRGLFSTRAPKRPNPIGLSVVRLRNVSGNILKIENVDMLDGTPRLDIKPLVPEFDHAENIRTGWLEKASAKVRDKQSDKRFSC
jgi:tRNA-Thr(GGU) m(6)t(6)A37 methyltransferase TsaA